MADQQFLHIYLNDHRAGAIAGIELTKRIIRNNRGNHFGTSLTRVLEQIKEDKTTLERVMQRLEVPRDRKKMALMWVGEKVGRAKLNARLTSYSPLSRLEELEALALGVEGKRKLWRSLGDVADQHERLAGVDFGELMARAEHQLAELETLHREAARLVLAAIPSN